MLFFYFSCCCFLYFFLFSLFFCCFLLFFCCCFCEFAAENFVSTDLNSAASVSDLVGANSVLHILFLSVFKVMSIYQVSEKVHCLNGLIDLHFGCKKWALRVICMDHCENFWAYWIDDNFMSFFLPFLCVAFMNVCHTRTCLEFSLRSHSCMHT